MFLEIAIEATSVESCSSVLEAMEPVIEPGLSKEIDHSDCDLSPSAVTVSHMHFFSTEQDILTSTVSFDFSAKPNLAKELSTVSSLVYKAAQKGRKCFRSTYAGLKPICTPVSVFLSTSNIFSRPVTSAGFKRCAVASTLSTYSVQRTSICSTL